MHLCVTSVPQSLFPQQSGNIVDPGFLDFRVGRFQDDGLVRLPLPEPDFEARLGIADLGRESNVGRFHALLVDVNVQILWKRQQAEG